MPKASKAQKLEIEKLNADLSASQDQLAFAIGKFSIEFAGLEHEANNTISIFLQFKTVKIGDLVLAAIRNVSTRLDILQSLIAGMSMEDSTRAELTECVESIRELNGYRNWLLHGAWGAWAPHLDEWQKTRPFTNRELRYTSKSFTASAVMDRAGECFPLRVRLVKAIQAYAAERNAREASPEKPE